MHMQSTYEVVPCGIKRENNESWTINFKPPRRGCNIYLPHAEKEDTLKSGRNVAHMLSRHTRSSVHLVLGR